MQPQLIGQLLTKLGLVTESQLQEALDLQRRRMPRKQIGEVLIEMGLLNEGSLRGILTAQQRKVVVTKQKGAADDELRKRLANAPLSEFLRVTRELGASDLHLSGGQRPMVRLHGSLRELPVDPLDEERCRNLLLGAIEASDGERLDREHSLDVAWSDPFAGRFRFHFFRHTSGIGGVMRAIASSAWEFEQLGLPQQVANICHADQGRRRSESGVLDLRRDVPDRKSTRLNSSHGGISRMPSSA